MLDEAKFRKWFLRRLCLAKNKKIGDLSERQRGQISIWTQSENVAIKRSFPLVKFPRATKIKIIKNCEGEAECNGAEA